MTAPFAGLIKLVANFWRSQNHVLCETCHGKVTNRIFYVYFWALSFHTDEQSGDCEKTSALYAEKLSAEGVIERSFTRRERRHSYSRTEKPRTTQRSPSSAETFCHSKTSVKSNTHPHVSSWLAFYGTGGVLRTNRRDPKLRSAPQVALSIDASSSPSSCRTRSSWRSIQAPIYPSAIDQFVDQPTNTSP